MRDLLAEVRARFEVLLLPAAKSELEFGTLPEHVAQSRSRRISKLRASSVRCHPDFTPRLEAVVGTVATNLGIPRKAFEVFVYPDSCINGFCVLGTFPLSVGITSHTVNTLDDGELAFVIGHEIGHGIFEGASSNVADDVSYENAILSRALELTMDRIGILASKDTDACMRAMLKTLSGLDSSQLRFDFSSYGHEVRQIEGDLVDSDDPLNSHPPFFIRYRAALSFLASPACEKLSRGVDMVSPDDIALPNRFIEMSLSRATDQRAKALIDEIITEMATWFAVFFVRNQVKMSLSKLSEVSGVVVTREDIERGVEFTSSFVGRESEVVLSEKLNSAIGKALRTAPRRVNRFVEALRMLFPSVQIMPLELYDKFFATSNFDMHSLQTQQSP